MNIVIPLHINSPLCIPFRVPFRSPLCIPFRIPFRVPFHYLLLSTGSLSLTVSPTILPCLGMEADGLRLELPAEGTRRTPVVTRHSLLVIRYLLLVPLIMAIAIIPEVPVRKGGNAFLHHADHRHQRHLHRHLRHYHRRCL